MLGKVSRNEKLDCGLNIQRSDGDLSSHLSQFLSLGSNTLKKIVAERIEDRQGLRFDANIWVHLLQNLVDAGPAAGNLKQRNINY